MGLFLWSFCFQWWVRQGPISAMDSVALGLMGVGFRPFAYVPLSSVSL